MPVRIEDILRLARAESGRTDYEEVCVFGDRTRLLSRVVVCWMATADAIEHAAELQADAIICHETLFFPYQTGWDAEAISWPANARRARLLARHDIACLRLHQSADELKVYESFAARLGLTEPIRGSEGFVRAYHIDTLSYGDLLVRVGDCGLPVLRFTEGDLDRQIDRIGLPWGGLALSLNIGYLEKLVEMGCQALIAGESDSYGHHFARESGVYMIETGHEASENPGLRLMVDWLKERFPELNVSYYETQPAYTAKREEQHDTHDR